jgi:hypothetical protein
MEQPQYNILWRGRVEFEYDRLYRDIGLGLTTWSPLASGLLTGKYLDGVPEGSRGALPGYEWLQGRSPTRPQREGRNLKKVADELGCTLAQLSIAWCTKNPRVSTVITGASRPEQVVENMKALDVIPLLCRPKPPFCGSHTDWSVEPIELDPPRRARSWSNWRPRACAIPTSTWSPATCRAPSRSSAATRAPAWSRRSVPE